MRISDWSSDVCSSDLARSGAVTRDDLGERHMAEARAPARRVFAALQRGGIGDRGIGLQPCAQRRQLRPADRLRDLVEIQPRSEEHTSELQSLMRISSAVFCLKKKTKQNNDLIHNRP